MSALRVDFVKNPLARFQHLLVTTIDEPVGGLLKDDDVLPRDVAYRNLFPLVDHTICIGGVEVETGPPILVDGDAARDINTSRWRQPHGVPHIEFIRIIGQLPNMDEYAGFFLEPLLRHAHAPVKNVSTTFFAPEWSKLTVTFWPSASTTRPYPNF